MTDEDRQLVQALLSAVDALHEDADCDREGHELADGSIDCGIRGEILAEVFDAAAALRRFELNPGDQLQTRRAGDYPEALWWCHGCSGLVRGWGFDVKSTPPPRCPECHASDFYPQPWVPSNSGRIE